MTEWSQTYIRTYEFEIYCLNSLRTESQIKKCPVLKSRENESFTGFKATKFFLKKIIMSVVKTFTTFSSNQEKQYYLLSKWPFTGCMCACSVDKSCPTLCNPMDPWPAPWPTSFLCPWDFSGKNTGSCHFLLQRIFLTVKTSI